MNWKASGLPHTTQTVKIYIASTLLHGGSPAGFIDCVVDSGVDRLGGARLNAAPNRKPAAKSLQPPLSRPHPVSNALPSTSPSHHGAPCPLTAGKAPPLQGVVRVPGDKSISHRALIFGALATGTTRVSGLLEAEDVINTARAVTALGAKAEKAGSQWIVLGRGVGGLSQPAEPLDFGNSGTGTRLMMGVV
ncbi:MAG: hypothetical protein ABL908_23005, partial [Hyphomicrobium sp.]